MEHIVCAGGDTERDGGMAGRAQRLSRHARRALLARGVDQGSNQGPNQRSHPGSRLASFIYWVSPSPNYHNIQVIAREGSVLVSEFIESVACSFYFIAGLCVIVGSHMLRLKGHTKAHTKALDGFK